MLGDPTSPQTLNRYAYVGLSLGIGSVVCVAAGATVAGGVTGGFQRGGNGEPAGECGSGVVGYAAVGALAAVMDVTIDTGRGREHLGRCGRAESPVQAGVVGGAAGRGGLEGWGAG